MDYLTQDVAVEFVSAAHSSLVEDGMLITCNVSHNWVISLDWRVLWLMIYRNEKELVEVLVKGGFNAREIELIYEPFKIHGIAVCRN